ncbi:hypothetical protein ACS0TY_018555 [Phlomoides rotata]
MWYKFGALASIRTVAPGIREISELPDWVFNVVYESWHNNPYLKRGKELEIKFITAASEDMTNSIQYPSFHFMKLQRPEQRAFTYIKAQETKPSLVANLTEDEVSTRRAWGVWVYLIEMEKVKYPFKIYPNSVNGSFLLNSMTEATTRFANDIFEQKRMMIWKNRVSLNDQDKVENESAKIGALQKNQDGGPLHEEKEESLTVNHGENERKRIKVVLDIVEGIHDRNHEVAAVGLNCEEQFVKADGYDPVILQSKGMNLVYDAISLRKHVGSDMVVMDYF